MRYRDSSIATHHGRGLIVSADSSHGVRIEGGSTGGVIEPVADDANAAITLRARGTGGIVLGNSSQGVSVPTPSTFSQGLSVTGNSSFSGAVFAVNGASSIVLSPTSTAGITIGNSSNQNPVVITGSSVAANSTHISLNSTRVNFAGSTTYFTVIRRVRVDFTIPAMAINAGAEEGDIAVTNLTTNACVTISPRGPLNSSVSGVLIQSYCSTAGQLHLTYHNAGTTISGSTMSAYALIHDMNVPAA